MLLPCRNAERYLREALDSLEQQTFHDFEIIAVDDGSTDSTADILNQRAARDARYVIVHSEPLGIVDALNAGFMRSRGELIARMDADDIADHERLALQVAMLDAHPEIAALGTRVQYFPLDEVRDGAVAYAQWLNGLIEPAQLARDLFIECPIAHPTLMLRRSVFQQLRGYRDEGWPEDYDLVLRIVEAGHLIANVPEVLHHWRERGDRLSRTDPRYSADAFRRCKVFFLRRMLLKRRPVAIWGAGPFGKAFARELQEQRIEVRGFIDIDPKKIGQAPYGLPVFSPDQLDDLRDCFVLAAVGTPGARDLIRAALRDAGFTEVEQFCAVA